jgi:hypothetical protein
VFECNYNAIVKEIITLIVQSLGAVLGKGGFGTVYQGLDVENGDFVAIKQINLQKIPKDQLNGIMVCCCV